MKNKWQLTNFEKDVLSFTLSGESNVLSLLRQQSSEIIKISRWYSGVGVSIKFYLNKINLKKTSSIRCVKDNFQITDVAVSINNGKYRAGVALFIENGFLEAFTMSNFLADSWPSSIDNYQLEYLTANKQRNLAELIQNWNFD